MLRLPSQQKFKPNKRKQPGPSHPGPSFASQGLKSSQNGDLRRSSQSGSSVAMPALSQGITQSTQDTVIATPQDTDHRDPSQSPSIRPSPSLLPSQLPTTSRTGDNYTKPPSQSKTKALLTTATLPGPRPAITKPSPRHVPLGLPPSVQTGRSESVEPSPPARGMSNPPRSDFPSGINRPLSRTPGPRPSITPDFRARDTLSPGARRSMTPGGTFSPGGRQTPGTARKGPSALLQAARAHAENGWTRPSPGRIPSRSARSASTRGPSMTPVPDEFMDQETLHQAGPSEVFDDPRNRVVDDQPVAEEARAVETESALQDNPPTEPDPVAAIVEKLEQATPTAVQKIATSATDREAILERRRRMMARITGAEVGPEGEAALRRSLSRQATPADPPSRSQPPAHSEPPAATEEEAISADPTPVNEAEENEQEADIAAQPDANMDHDTQIDFGDVDMGDFEPEVRPPSPAVDGTVQSDVGSDAEQRSAGGTGEKVRSPSSTAVAVQLAQPEEVPASEDEAMDGGSRSPSVQGKSPDRLFLSRSSSAAASPSAYGDSQAEEDELNDDDEAEPVKSAKTAKTTGAQPKVRKKTRAASEGEDVEAPGNDGAVAKPKRKRKSKKKSATEDTADATGNASARPKKAKRKSPSTLAEGENEDEEAAVETKRNKKAEKKSKADRTRFLQPSLDELQAGGIVDEEADLNLFTMADLATKVTHGRVSERAGVLAQFHHDLGKQKAVRKVEKDWIRWERQQIIRRKLRSLKNANREQRREEARQEGRNPEDDVSEDEPDSEEEFEIHPDRLTPPPPGEEEPIMREQPLRIELPGENEAGQGADGEGYDAEIGDGEAVHGNGEGQEGDGERPFFLEPLLDEEEIPAEPVEEDELAAFGHREDDPDEEDNDDFDRMRDENGEIVWDALHDEEDGADAWMDARERQQEAIRRGEDTREVQEADSATRLVNQNTFRKARPAARWNADETEFFYEVALPTFGENPFMLQTAFPGRTQLQLKKKMNKEAKLDPERYAAAVSRRMDIDKDYLAKAAGYDDETNFEAEIAFLQQCQADVAILKRLDAGEVIDNVVPAPIHVGEDGLQAFDNDGFEDGKDDYDNEKADDDYYDGAEGDGAYGQYDHEGQDEKVDEEEEEEDINLDDYRDEVMA